jgi:hypothetical protein
VIFPLNHSNEPVPGKENAGPHLTANPAKGFQQCQRYQNGTPAAISIPNIILSRQNLPQRDAPNSPTPSPSQNLRGGALVT